MYVVITPAAVTVDDRPVSEESQATLLAEHKALATEQADAIVEQGGKPSKYEAPELVTVSSEDGRKLLGHLALGATLEVESVDGSENVRVGVYVPSAPGEAPRNALAVAGVLVGVKTASVAAVTPRKPKPEDPKPIDPA